MYTEIQEAFLDGINEVFTTLFTNRVMFSFLDKEQTEEELSIYGEVPKKYYHEPIALVANVFLESEKYEHPDKQFKNTAVFKVPTRQLIINNIPHTQADLPALERGKIHFNGVDYLVDSVKPHTLVADVWQMYVFNCTELGDTTSGSGEE